MKTVLACGAFALLPILAAQPALAGTTDDANEIRVETALLHPSAGLMNDHMHDGGEVMVGLRLERRRYSGQNVSGTDKIDDADVLAAGYTVRAQSMEMDMVMLDLMYAPNDDVTLMVMPHYMWHRMTMVGINPMAGGMDMSGDSMAGHSSMLGYGETHSHGAEGFGDTLVSASYRLAKGRALRAHATLGVWVPTGSDDLTNPDGTFVHYGMQPGSGTWDIEPAVTVSGSVGPVGWGGQASYKWRSEKRNDVGFSFGDKLQTSAWASYRLTGRLGTTARVEYVQEGAIQGEYNGPHKTASPSDGQGNYGGDTVSLGLGANWFLPISAVNHPQLSAEFAVPIHQDLNGIQMPQDWRVSIGLSQTF